MKKKNILSDLLEMPDRVVKQTLGHDLETLDRVFIEKCREVGKGIGESLKERPVGKKIGNFLDLWKKEEKKKDKHENL